MPTEPAAPPPVDETKPDAAPPDEGDGWDDELDLDPDDAREWAEFRAKAEGGTEAQPAAAGAGPGATSPKPPAPTSQGPAAEKKPLPRHLVSDARRLGLEDGDFEGYSADELKDAVDRAAKVADLKLRERMADARQNRPQQPKQQANDQPAAPAKDQPTPEAEDILAKLGITDRDQWEPKFLDVVEKLAKFAAEPRVSKDFQEAADGFRQFQAERQAERDWKMLDGFFSKHEAVYGRGRTLDLDDGAERERRLTVYQKLAGLIAEGRHTTFDRDIASIHGRLGFAPARPPEQPAERPATLTEAYGVNGPAPTPPAADRPRDPETGRFLPADEADQKAREEAWMRAASPAPTQRRESELPHGLDRAARNIAAMQRARGQAVDEE